MEKIRRRLVTPNSQRIYYLADGLRLGMAPPSDCTAHRNRPVVYRRDRRNRARRRTLAQRCRWMPTHLREVKALGFSDRRIAELTRNHRSGDCQTPARAGHQPVFKTVDTCGAEFQAFTPYLYSSYDGEDEAEPDGAQEVIILGGGPNRIGQGHRIRLLLRPCQFRPAGGRLRDHHGQLQSGDGVDRLRHFRPALFRAADLRRRAGDCRARKAAGRDCSIRRPDAAQTGSRSGARRSADSGHAARRDRSRRGSRALQRVGRATRPAPAAAACWRAIWTRRSPAPPDRLPGADSSLLRAGRPGDGDCRQRGRRSGRYLDRRCTPRATAAAGRPLSRRRDRGRRRRDFRRRDSGGRRRDGAYRARRHPFGRQRLRAAAAHTLSAAVSARADSRRPSCWRGSWACSA